MSDFSILDKEASRTAAREFAEMVYQELLVLVEDKNRPKDMNQKETLEYFRIGERELRRLKRLGLQFRKSGRDNMYDPKEVQHYLDLTKQTI